MMALASNGFISIKLEKTLPARGQGPEEYYSIEVTPKGKEFQVGESSLNYDEQLVNFKLLTLERLTVTGITSDDSDNAAKVAEFTAIFKKTPIADFVSDNAYITQKLEKQIEARFKKYDDGWRLTKWDTK